MLCYWWNFINLDSDIVKDNDGMLSRFNAQLNKISYVEITMYASKFSSVLIMLCIVTLRCKTNLNKRSFLEPRAPAASCCHWVISHYLKIHIAGTKNSNPSISNKATFFQLLQIFDSSPPPVNTELLTWKEIPDGNKQGWRVDVAA